jgi:hypothetical protein
MDTMRGNFGSLAETGGYDPAEDEGHQAPPPAIGQDERRMQVRAYNHWASLLADRNFPAIEDLEPANLPDFGPYSVLLDFSTGIENPGISFLGDKLADECGIVEEELTTLADVPARSLLTRITDHYMQILANQAPIGFEAEFVNQRGVTIAYRGILLPFSSDDDTIDFIYGVINWKELADAQAADELLLEIDQALEPKSKVPALEPEPLTDWADGPGTDLSAEPANDLDDHGEAEAEAEEFAVEEFSLPEEAEVTDEDDEDLPLPSFGSDNAEDEDEDDDDLPVPSFGSDEAEEEEDDDKVTGPSFGSLLRMPIQAPKAPLELSDEAFEPAENYDAPSFGDEPLELNDEAKPGEYVENPAFAEEPLELTEPVYEPAEEPEEAVADEPAPVSVEVAYDETVFDDVATAIELPELDPADMELGDWLAAAREMAVAARGSEERTREALYDAIGRAYDFSLAAADAQNEFDELLTDAGLTVQDRAPMTPVVKLVFGADYDKTRLTEYAAALTHAHRLHLPQGTVGDFLREHEGGLKGVVKAERRLRREEAGKAVEPVDAPRHALAKKLRALPGQEFSAIAVAGSEFALVLIRRTEEGDVVMLGEVPDDVALVERAARRIVG